MNGLNKIVPLNIEPLMFPGLGAAGDDIKPAVETDEDAYHQTGGIIEFSDRKETLNPEKRKKTEFAKVSAAEAEKISVPQLIAAGENILLSLGINPLSPAAPDILKSMGINSLDDIKNIKRIDYDFDECGKSAVIKNKDKSSSEFMIYSDGGMQLIQKDPAGNIIYERETDCKGNIVQDRAVTLNVKISENAKQTESASSAQTPCIRGDESIPDGRGGFITIQRNNDGSKYSMTCSDGIIYFDAGETPGAVVINLPGGGEIGAELTNGKISAASVTNAGGSGPETIMSSPQTITHTDGTEIKVNDDGSQTITNPNNNVSVDKNRKGQFAGFVCEDIEEVTFEAENINPNFTLNKNAAVWKRDGEIILQLNGKIDSQVKQGNTGDCWLLSSVHALASSKKGRQIISDAILQNPDGSITAKLPGVKRAYKMPDTYLIARDPDQDPSRPKFTEALTNLGAKMIGIDRSVSKKPFSSGDDDMLVIEAAFSRDMELHSEDYGGDNSIDGGFSGDAFKSLVPNAEIENYHIRSSSSAELDNMFDEACSGEGNIVMTFDTAPGRQLFGKTIDGGTFEYKNTELFGVTIRAVEAHEFAVTKVEKREDGARLITFINPHDSEKKYTMNWEEFKRMAPEYITTCNLSASI